MVGHAFGLSGLDASVTGSDVTGVGAERAVGPTDRLTMEGGAASK